jgi:hypothetical protein
VPYLPFTFQQAAHNELLKFKDTPSDVRTNVPILDGITYLKGLTSENPMLIRSTMAGEFNYGTPPGVDFFRPINYTVVSENVLCYTSSDDFPGVSHTDTVSSGSD